jgi:hypothetical protein
MGRKTNLENGMALLEYAKHTRDKKIRKLCRETASELFGIHVENEKNRKNRLLPLTLFIYFILITGSLIVSFHFLGTWISISVFIIEMALLPMVIGLHLFMTGRISQSEFFKIYKYGFDDLIRFFTRNKT